MKHNRLKKILAYERANMLSICFSYSYIVAPIYIGISALLLTAFGVLMSIDEEKNLVPGLICLGVWLLFTVAVLATVPFVRKRVIRSEMAYYDFDASKGEAKDEYDFSTDDYSLVFDRYGMTVDGQLFYYNHMKKGVVTSNHLLRIGVYLLFVVPDQVAVTLGVNPTTLRMLECLDIRLENEDDLRFIAEHTQEAFEQIYNKGRLTR